MLVLLQAAGVGAGLLVPVEGRGRVARVCALELAGWCCAGCLHSRVQLQGADVSNGAGCQSRCQLPLEGVAA